MTERAYRLILGILLAVVLYLDLPVLYYCYVGLLFIEGVSPVRVPVLYNRWRFGHAVEPTVTETSLKPRIPFAAEQAMRLTFGSVMVLTLFILPTPYWFLNWVIACFLILSGLSNVCPLVLFFRAIGFR